MGKKYLLPLLLAVLLLAGCGGQTAPPAASPEIPQEEPLQMPEPAPFTLAVYPEFSLHPTLAANRANLTLSPLLYEPLFQVDNSFQAVPALCRTYAVSEDKLSWTFTLRSGVTFSNGGPLTGEAAADALNTARAAGNRFEARLQNVASVSGEGETVTVTLRRPNSQLPVLLDIPIALGTGDRPAGTGPYVLSQSGENLSLTARTDWWRNQKLPVQTIPLKSVSRSDELLLAFNSGDISLVDVDLLGTGALGYSGNYETWDYPSTDLLSLGFNPQRWAGRNAASRLALARAVDRESVASVDYADHAVPTALPVHPSSPLYDETRAAALAYTPDGLAERLKELRLAGRELIVLVNSENAAKVSAAQRLAYQLESAGMKPDLRQLAFADYEAALKAGDFDLYLGEVVLTADFDLSCLLSYSGALNYGKWYSDEIDALLSALAGAEGAERSAAAGALFDLLNEQAPIVPICFKNGSVLTQWGRLSGLSPVRGDVFWQFEHWNIP